MWTIMTVESVRLKIDFGLKLHVNIEHRRMVGKIPSLVWNKMAVSGWLSGIRQSELSIREVRK